MWPTEHHAATKRHYSEGTGRWHSCPREAHKSVSAHIHVNYSPTQLAQSHLTRDKEFNDKNYASSTKVLQLL